MCLADIVFMFGTVMENIYAFDIVSLAGKTVLLVSYISHSKKPFRGDPYRSFHNASEGRVKRAVQNQ